MYYRSVLIVHFLDKSIDIFGFSFDILLGSCLLDGWIGNSFRGRLVGVRGRLFVVWDVVRVAGIIFFSSSEVSESELLSFLSSSDVSSSSSFSLRSMDTLLSLFVLGSMDALL